MNVIIEGQLSSTWSMKEVLQSVASLTSVDTGVLRIACPSANLHGRLSLARGRYIAGARIHETDESGYTAARKLLSVQDGNFAFLDSAGSHPPELDQTLHISIARLMALMPDLPETADDLFDEAALLDQVFGGGSSPGARHRDTAEIMPQSDLSPESADRQPLHPLEAMSPFLLDTPPAGEGGPIIAGRRCMHVNLEEGRITFGKLKSLASERLSGTRALAWLLAAAVLAALALFIAANHLASPPAPRPATGNPPAAPER